MWVSDCVWWKRRGKKEKDGGWRRGWTQRRKKKTTTQLVVWGKECESGIWGENDQNIENFQITN